MSSIPKEAAEDLGLVDEEGEVPDSDELPDVVFHHDRERGEWILDADA